MGHPTKVQLIRRKKGPDQWYINFPTVIAEAMDFTKGEQVEWHIEDRELLALRRLAPPPSVLKKNRRPFSKNSSPSGAKGAGPVARNGSGKEA